MSEIVLKVEVPTEFKDKFEAALAKDLKNFMIDVKFSIADRLLKNSEMTDGLALQLGSELKERVAKRQGL